MKKLNFAICDLEAAYACRLMNYLTDKQNIPFEILVFSSLDSMEVFTREHAIELLLISSRMMCGQIREMDIHRVVILSEGELVAGFEDYPTVYKYQASGSLAAEVMEYYAAQMQDAMPFYMKRNASVIGVYSPIGRCGKTCFALTYGQILAQRQKVLYLNLEDCAGFELLTGQNPSADLTDAMYFVRQNKGNVIVKINALVQRLGELAYVPPAYSAADLADVEEQEWLQLLDSVTALGGYETVILDMAGTVEARRALLSACTKLYVPVCDGIAAKAKLQQFEKLLTDLDCEEIRKELRYLHLPFAEPAGQGEYALEQLINGEMGDFVRRLLREEEAAA